jgi:hypothetical protein
VSQLGIGQVGLIVAELQFGTNVLEKPEPFPNLAPKLNVLNVLAMAVTACMTITVFDHYYIPIVFTRSFLKYRTRRWRKFQK